VQGVRLNAAHTIVELAQDSDAPAIGEQLVFDIGNADGTVFLHEQLQVLRGSEAVGTWSLHLIA
jgi:D-serine deaminase-like pyridoxal phosphate-dependent protein